MDSTATNSVSHSAAFELEQPVDRLFPLFSPEGEKAWVPGWDYEKVSEGTTLHEDYVFLTRQHDHASSDAIWIVKRHQPERHRVQFYKVEPGQKLGIIEVECVRLSEQRTRVQVSYQYIALSAAGRRFIAGFGAADYQAFIAEWERLLLDHFNSRTAD